MVDDLIIPIEYLPKHMQQMVYQARDEGKDITFTTQYEEE